MFLTIVQQVHPSALLLLITVATTCSLATPGRVHGKPQVVDHHFSIRQEENANKTIFAE